MQKKVNVLLYNERGGAYTAAKRIFDCFPVNYSVHFLFCRKSMSRWNLEFIRFALYFLYKRIRYPLSYDLLSLNFTTRWGKESFDCDILVLEWLGNGALPRLKDLKNFKGHILVHHHDEMYFDNYYYSRYIIPWYVIPDRLKYRGYFSSLRSVNVKLLNIYPSDWLKRRHEMGFGIVIPNIGPSSGYVKRRLKFSHESIFLMIANKADSDARKGLDRIVNLAVELEASFHFIIIGSERKWLRKFENGCSVESVGFLNYGEMAKYYKVAYASLVPSYGDNYPNVCLESGAWNLPVITSMEGGTSEALNFIAGAKCDFTPKDFLNKLKTFDGLEIDNNIRGMNHEIVSSWVKMFDGLD
jgi:hypothetical protein